MRLKNDRRSMGEMDATGALRYYSRSMAVNVRPKKRTSGRKLKDENKRREGCSTGSCPLLLR
jgi:hypothetical protein